MADGVDFETWWISSLKNGAFENFPEAHYPEGNIKPVFAARFAWDAAKKAGHIPGDLDLDIDPEGEGYPFGMTREGG